MASTRLQIVTGKGGVGKTTVACALALAHARAGKRTLLAELNGGDRVAHAFDVPPVGYDMREIHSNLWAIDVNPEASLREYVLLIIRIEALYKAAFENRFVKNFLRLLPALGELTMLGKIWYEWELGQQGKHKYDVIVIDAPATGHARAILSAPHAVMASVPTGPMRENAQRIEDMLQNKMSELIVVTTAADTPVAEAEELIHFGRAKPFSQVRVVVNQAIEPLPPSLLQASQSAAALLPDFAALPASLTRRDTRTREGLAHLRRLGTDLAAAVYVPRMGHTLRGVALQALNEPLAPLWRATP